jgi:hypothetical protein
MKVNTKLIGIFLLITLTYSCANLDLNPLSSGSSENWYQDESEIEMSLNDLWRPDFFPIDGINWDDDLLHRNGPNTFTLGTLTSESSEPANRWSSLYKAISRSLKILNALETKALNIPHSKFVQYKGEAYFMIGFAYGELATYFGDCVLNKTGMSLDEAYTASRSPRRDVFNFAYACLDSAAADLPLTYTGEQRPTKGAALGFKTRFALCAGDYQLAADAARKCMNLGVYKLQDNYLDLFKADSSPELLFYFKGNLSQKYGISPFDGIKNFVIRKLGGYANMSPSLELLCSYTCIDGLPIDESPLYNPKDPFENRDPRLSYTIQPFKTKFSKDYAEYVKSKEDGTFPSKYPDYITLGYEYNPSPYATKIYEVSTGKMVTNNDSKAANQYSAFNGLILRKFVKDNWADYDENGGVSDNCYPYLRYAEVLLSYAEAMNELGECSQAVLDSSINLVRARAYNGTGISFPRVLVGTQAQLRKIIRMERRSEFAFEGIRYRDLLRWKIADKAYNKSMYYLSRAWSGSANWNGKTGEESNCTLSSDFMILLKNWDNGNFPIGGIPKIDENGLPDLSSMESEGYITTFYKMNFDSSKNYLWPIPASDILVNSNLTQNPGY